MLSSILIFTAFFLRNTSSQADLTEMYSYVLNCLLKALTLTCIGARFLSCCKEAFSLVTQSHSPFSNCFTHAAACCFVPVAVTQGGCFLFL